MRIKIRNGLSLNIPSKLWQKIVAYFQNLYGGVIPNDYQIEAFTKDRILSAAPQLVRLESLRISKNEYCLDAGCGIGVFIVVANLAGYNFYGYEVDKAAFLIARDLFTANNLNPKKIVHTTNPTDLKKTFKLITSFEVVEHTSNMENYLKKLITILHPQGKLFIETPNYQIPYEPHFYLFLLPIPKTLNWLIFRIYGKNNKKYFDELNLVTNTKLESFFKTNNLPFENIGLLEWQNQLNSSSDPNRSPLLSKLFRIARITKTEFIWSWLATQGFYTPLVYLVSHPKSNNS